MKFLPNRRDKVAEEAAFLDKCHRTKNRRSDAAAILRSEFFFDALKRPNTDAWNDFYDCIWVGSDGDIKGSDILSALRDHLAALQKEQCCYCGQALLKGGYARPIEHVLSRSDHPRWSLHFWNVAVACERCNRIKRDKCCSAFPKNRRHYPEPAEFTQQYHPRFHIHGKHVRYTTLATNDLRYTLYVGKSVQGRNLVNEVLQRAALEEALESNDPRIAGAIASIRACLDKQDKRARDAISAFEQTLRDMIVAQAAHL